MPYNTFPLPLSFTR